MMMNDNKLHEVPDFFARNGFPASARAQCWRFAESLYPSSAPIEAPNQGYCSYTLLLRDHDSVVQFRPSKHRLDTEIAAAAREALGDLVPHTQLLGSISFPLSCRPSRQDGDDDNNNNNSSNNTGNDILLVYSHSLLPGTPLPALLDTHFPLSTTTTTISTPPQSTFLPLTPPLPCLPPKAQPHLQPTFITLNPLVRALATRYFLPSHRASIPPSSPRLAPLKRRIGLSLRARLALLRRGLPRRFWGVVREVEGAMGEIAGDGEGDVGGDGEGLPWVVTHGDLVGAGVGNVLAEFDSSCVGSRCHEGGGQEEWGSDGGWAERGDRGREGPVVRLCGLVDWAEGEYLPFGVGLYGLEEVLGRMVPVAGDTGKWRFEYYACADQLRKVLWEELEAAVPALVEDVAFRARVKKARLLGLLLWYGIAFDDGALNRVVSPGRDDEELQKLDMFLLGEDHGGDPDAAEESDEDVGRDSDSGCFFMGGDDTQSDGDNEAERASSDDM